MARRVTENVRACYGVRAGSFHGHEPTIHCEREKQTVSGTMPKEGMEFFEYGSAGN